MASVPQYLKLTVTLSLWVVAFSLYILWGVFSPAPTQPYVYVTNMSPPRAQPEANGSVSLTSSLVPRRSSTSAWSPLRSSSMGTSTRNGTRSNNATVIRTSSLPSVLPLASAKPSSSLSSSSSTSSSSSSSSPSSSPSPSTSPSSSSSSTSSSSSSSPSSSPSPSTSPSSSPSTLSSSLPPVNGSTTLTAPATPKLLCVSFTGRLGNELFEYASTLGLALTLNRAPVFQGSVQLSSVLQHFAVSPAKLTASQLNERCRKARVMGETSCCKYREEMARLDPAHDYRVGTYLQSYRYFHRHFAHIRSALTFNDDIRAQAGRTVRELRQKQPSSTLIGVHIRHGDMTSQRNQKLGYPVASPAYINKSVSYFRQLYPGCAFVVSSDSVAWCRDHFPKGANVTFLTGNPPALDMQILSSLDHVIITFGTFSWWTGYLSGGRVVYMKDFIRANTYIGKAFNPRGRDYILPEWVPL